MPGSTTPALGAERINMPCLACGLDYIDRLATQATDAIYNGCECDLCAPYTNGEIEPGERPVADLTARMHTARVVLNDGTNATVVLCPDHANQVGSARFGGRAGNCPSCRNAYLTRGGRWGDALDPFLVYGADNLSRIDVYTEGSATIRGWERATVLHRTVFAQPSTLQLADNHGAPLCQTCATDVAVCEGSCGGYVMPGRGSYCAACDVDGICYGCYDNMHAGHDYDSEDDYDDEPAYLRAGFSPRSGIREALDVTAEAGVSILSTRALGMEIESARGNLEAVVEAEAGAVMPLLAAVGSDCSVRGENAVELRLLPLRGLWAEYGIKYLHDAMRNAHYAPDRSAGVHMHVDCSDLDGAGTWRAFSVLVALEPVLFAIAGASRQANEYTRKYEDPMRVVANAVRMVGDNPGWFDAAQSGQRERYYGINCHSFHAHNTIEIRVFESSHTEDSIKRYINAAALITAAVDYAQSSEWHTFAERAADDLEDAQSLALWVLASLDGEYLPGAVTEWLTTATTGIEVAA